MRILLAALVILAAAPAWAAPLKIGVIVHLSGEWAREGNAFREGVELAAEELRAGGREVELVIEDSQFSSAVALTAAKKLVNVDKVQAAVVGSLSELHPCAGVFETAKIPTIVLWDSAPEVDNLGDYIFGIGPWAPGTGQKSARYAYNDLGLRRAALLANPRQWSVSVVRYFREEFTRLGGKIVFDEELQPSDVEVRSTLTKLRKSAADILYAPLEDQVVPVYRMTRQMNAVPRIMTSDILTDDMIRGLGNDLEGAYYTKSEAPDSPRLLHMVEQYRARFKTEPEHRQLTAWAYDAVHLFSDADKAAGGADAVKKFLYSVNGYDGASGRITISPGGSVVGFPGMYQLRGGKFVSVEAP